MDSEPPSPKIWQKTIRFAADYANWLFDLFGKKIAVPKIYHGPAGSMDVYWENEPYNLFINIPSDNEPATFVDAPHGCAYFGVSCNPTETGYNK